jgi:hypothetical protein
LTPAPVVSVHGGSLLYSYSIHRRLVALRRNRRESVAMKNDGYWRMLAATALVAALAWGCGGQAAVDHGGSLVSDEGQIAFMRATSFDGPDIESEVYTINVDGSGERRLTDTPGLDGFPSCSPAGERIAFASDRASGNWELYVMDHAESGPSNTVLCPHSSQTRMSPLERPFTGQSPPNRVRALLAHLRRLEPPTQRAVRTRSPSGARGDARRPLD